MKNYGYKVCYRETGKTKVKIHLITNSYDLCVWEIQYYENHKQIDKRTKKIIVKPEWFIIPIRTFLEYKWLWKDCPF